MIKKLDIKNILFLDIETVPEFAMFHKLPIEKQLLWEEKTQYQRKDYFSAEEFYDRAGIWAEFGKIICISVGHFAIQGESRKFRITTFSGEEKTLLLDLKNLLDSHFNRPKHLLCAHNGKEFDFPYIARRMLVHDLELPLKLNLFGKKPWEVPHLDTLDLWKFGDYKHYTSLKLLTSVLGITSPKDDINGKEVRDVFYEKKDINRIIDYCEKDVVAIAQIILKFRQEPLLDQEEIISV